MARKVRESAAVAYLNESHPDAKEGAGYYEVSADDRDDHTNASFGKKLESVLNNPNEPGVTPDPENNEGHFVYAGASDDDE